ncbi:hypothetical protein [Flavisolibacter tropicus]|uniref:Lipoprotein n=1 Tax=Flavisolibacter tropicus TaxID=1492898 RepID=A0A172TSZ9_9BACT|nr:hypothetical protein [Flavisolibacter tropicus]ANE50201.1 hypothetical protein SY85_06475 [Flavisolibacter tropicus]
MKKLFALFVIAASISACNSSGNTGSADVKDSALEKIDSAGDARVDSVKQATDSLQNKVEASFDKTDSANKALADTAHKK